MPLDDETIQRLLAPKVKPKKQVRPKAAPSYSTTWTNHFHHRQPNQRDNQIGPLSYNFGVEKECSLLGCGQPTYYEVDGEPKCSFHALATLAHKLEKDIDGNSNQNGNGSNTDYF
jgi:hypothetical protein